MNKIENKLKNENVITMEYDFSGIHFIASFIDCEKERLTNIEMLKKYMTEAVVSSGATILGQIDYIFESPKPDEPGYTCCYLLSESHATIHTYPEKASCHVDLFTCGTKCSYEKFSTAIKTYLNPNKIIFEVIKRDTKLSTLEKYSNIS